MFRQRENKTALGEWVFSTRGNYTAGGGSQKPNNTVLNSVRVLIIPAGVKNLCDGLSESLESRGTVWTTCCSCSPLPQDTADFQFHRDEGEELLMATECSQTSKSASLVPTLISVVKKTNNPGDIFTAATTDLHLATSRPLRAPAKRFVCTAAKNNRLNILEQQTSDHYVEERGQSVDMLTIFTPAPANPNAIKALFNRQRSHLLNSATNTPPRVYRLQMRLFIMRKETRTAYTQQKKTHKG